MAKEGGANDGARRHQGRLFYEFRLEDQIPGKPPAATMNVFVTVVLADMLSSQSD